MSTREIALLCDSARLPSHMRAIGLIGGWGWEASAAYYRIMNREVRRQLGGWHSARVVLDSLDLHPLTTARTKDDFEAIRRTLVASAIRLRDAGAELIVIACNTVHRFADSAREAVDIPLLHIADAAGEALTQDAHARVGLIGTLATMQSPFYRRHLADAYGLDVVLPSRALRGDVADLIKRDLTSGDHPEAAAPKLDLVIDYLAEQGCSAVLLACTDFGLAYGATDTAIIQRTLPLYDAGVLHALAAVRLALADRRT